MHKRLSIEEITTLFASGLNCSQVVLSVWAEDLGYDVEEAYRMASPFGGGMLCGDTCGAVTGALIALGLAHGNSESSDETQKRILREKTQKFQQQFIKRTGSTICRELLGYDFSKEGQLEAAIATGKIMDFCPRAVYEALEVLNETM